MGGELQSHVLWAWILYCFMQPVTGYGCFMAQTEFDFTSFGQVYRSFLQTAEKFAALPTPVARWLLSRRAGTKSPLLWQQDSFKAGAFAAGFEKEWPALWRKKLEDHAVFCLNAFAHHRLSPNWVARHVTADLGPLREILAEGRGCMFLTFHHAFHHTLFTIAGLAGLPVKVLAAPEESSPIFSDIGPYISRLHRGCQKHFNGGQYLFFQTPRQAVHMTKQAFQEIALIFSLNDFTVAKLDAERDHYSVFGRQMPVATGSIRLACKMSVPLVVGGLLRKGEGYRLVYRPLVSQSYQDVMRDYFAELENLSTQQPAFWDGLLWLGAQPALIRK